MGRKPIDIECKIPELEATLKQYGGLPSTKQNASLRNNINYYFTKYAEHPSIKRLMYIYAHRNCYPLPNTKLGPRPEYCGDIITNADFDYINWRQNVSFEYILHVLNLYGTLPAEGTKPMKELHTLIDRYYEYANLLVSDEGKKLKSIIYKLIESGVNEQYIIDVYNTFSFVDDEVQNRIYKELIKHGACAIAYIARIAIPGIILSSKFVYSYYYSKNNRNIYHRGKCALSNFDQYCSDNDTQILYVHYRDAYLCPVDDIRQNAKKYYRNWKEFPPQTTDEWIAYGEMHFFNIDNIHDYDMSTYTSYDVEFVEWHKTIIQKYIEKGCAYFRMRIYDQGFWKYLDYYLFLLEQGYTLKDSKLMEYFEFPLDSKDIVPEDEEVKLKVVKLQPDNIIDKNGVIYNKKLKEIVAFSTDLSSYKLIEGTTSIRSGAFRFCPSLESLELPKSFNGNLGYSKLKKVIIPTGTKTYFEDKLSKYLQQFTFYPNGEKVEYAEIVIDNELISAPYCIDYIVPNGIEKISKNAFNGCPELHSVVIPGSVKHINESLFWCAYNLETVIFEEGVEDMWSHGMFGNCKALKTVQFPNSLKQVYGYMFEKCDSLAQVVMPDSIERIYDNFFSDCPALKNVHLPNNLRSLGDRVFSRCSSLKNIKLPDSLAEIGWSAFQESGIENIEFPNSMRHIGNNAFCRCGNLKKVLLNEGLETIADRAFEHCESIEEIVIPEGVKMIGSEVFTGCWKLRNIYLPSTLEKIGHLFVRCMNEEYIVENIYVPAKCYDKYKEMLPYYSRYFVKYNC